MCMMIYLEMLRCWDVGVMFLFSKSTTTVYEFWKWIMHILDYWRRSTLNLVFINWFIIKYCMWSLRVLHNTPLSHSDPMGRSVAMWNLNGRSWIDSDTMLEIMVGNWHHRVFFTLQKKDNRRKHVEFVIKRVWQSILWFGLWMRTIGDHIFAFLDKFPIHLSISQLLWDLFGCNLVSWVEKLHFGQADLVQLCDSICCFF